MARGSVVKGLSRMSKILKFLILPFLDSGSPANLVKPVKPYLDHLGSFLIEQIHFMMSYQFFEKNKGYPFPQFCTDYVAETWKQFLSCTQITKIKTFYSKLSAIDTSSSKRNPF